MSSDRFCKLLFVGRPVPEKGLPDLLRVLAAMAELPWLLSVVGDRAPFELPITGIHHRISFLGRVDQSEVARVMQRHDVLVVPSRYETFGTVALEGLATGLVVVAARVGRISFRGRRYGRSGTRPPVRHRRPRRALPDTAQCAAGSNEVLVVARRRRDTQPACLAHVTPVATFSYPMIRSCGYAKRCCRISTGKPRDTAISL